MQNSAPPNPVHHRFYPFDGGLPVRTCDSSPSWEGNTIHKDDAPVAANASYHEHHELSESDVELRAARAAYHRARKELTQADVRIRQIPKPNREALMVIQSAYQTFKKAAQRYEAALNAYLALG
ncbi:MAG TPA: hypothetical protein VIX91_11830 [Candidatus Acidoferrum sp.]